MSVAEAIAVVGMFAMVAAIAWADAWASAQNRKRDDDD